MSDASWIAPCPPGSDFQSNVGESGTSLLRYFCLGPTPTFEHHLKLNILDKNHRLNRIRLFMHLYIAIVKMI